MSALQGPVFIMEIIQSQNTDQGDLIRGDDQDLFAN